MFNSSAWFSPTSWISTGFTRAFANWLLDCCLSHIFLRRFIRLLFLRPFSAFLLPFPASASTRRHFSFFGGLWRLTWSDFYNRLILIIYYYRMTAAFVILQKKGSTFRLSTRKISDFIISYRVWQNRDKQVTKSHRSICWYSQVLHDIHNTFLKYYNITKSSTEVQQISTFF